MRTVDVTATGGSDYGSADLRLHFTDDESDTTDGSIEISSDLTVEGPEIFKLIIVSSYSERDNSIGQPSEATVIIVDSGR